MFVCSSLPSFFCVRLSVSDQLTYKVLLNTAVLKLVHRVRKEIEQFRNLVILCSRKGPESVKFRLNIHIPQLKLSAIININLSNPPERAVSQVSYEPIPKQD